MTTFSSCNQRRFEITFTLAVPLRRDDRALRHVSGSWSIILLESLQSSGGKRELFPADPHDKLGVLEYRVLIA